jgi:hypothetical protein
MFYLFCCIVYWSILAAPSHFNLFWLSGDALEYSALGQGEEAQDYSGYYFAFYGVATVTKQYVIYDGENEINLLKPLHFYTI